MTNYDDTMAGTTFLMEKSVTGTSPSRTEGTNCDDELQFPVLVQISVLSNFTRTILLIHFCIINKLTF
jgi:hypothetical protein